MTSRGAAEKRATFLPLAIFIVACVAAPNVSPEPVAQSQTTSPLPTPTAEATYDQLSWRETNPMITARSHLSAVAVGGSIYAIGGLARGAASTSVFDRYDTGADTWSSLPALPAAADHTMAAALDSSIFVFGGSFAQPSTRAWRFDLATNRWSSIAPMPEARAAGGAAAMDSRIYVFGGFGDTRQLLATAYVYDPAIDRWSRIPDVLTPREHLAVTTFRGRVCGMGGHFGDGRARTISECYERGSNRWTSMPPLPRPASDFDAVVAADAIWAVGDDVQVFDGTTWRLGPQLKTPRFGLALTSVSSSLYAIGGSARTAAPDGIVERLDVR